MRREASQYQTKEFQAIAVAQMRDRKRRKGPRTEGSETFHTVQSAIFEQMLETTAGDEALAYECLREFAKMNLPDNLQKNFKKDTKKPVLFAKFVTNMFIELSQQESLDFDFQGYRAFVKARLPELKQAAAKSQARKNSRSLRSRV